MRLCASFENHAKLSIPFLKRKDNSFHPFFYRLHFFLLRHRHQTPLKQSKGILTFFPFGVKVWVDFIIKYRNPIYFTDIILLLRIGSLESKFNWLETLFHSSAHKNLTYVIATTTKICTIDRSNKNYFFIFKSVYN